jgi:hypothetical protein
MERTDIRDMQGGEVFKIIDFGFEKLEAYHILTETYRNETIPRSPIHLRHWRVS